MGGNLRFKIDWASLIVGRNLPFLLCFTLYLTVISKGDLTKGFLHYEFGVLIHGEAYFRNFTVSTMYFSACSTILFNNVAPVTFDQLPRKSCLSYKALIF